MHKGGHQPVALPLPLEAPPERPARQATLVRGNHAFAGAEIGNLSPALADELGTVREIVTRLLKRFERAGWRNIRDQNTVFDDGFASVAHSHTDDTRMGAAWRYLTAEVRRRPNLAVMGEPALALRLKEPVIGTQSTRLY